MSTRKLLATYSSPSGSIRVYRIFDGYRVECSWKSAASNYMTDDKADAIATAEAIIQSLNTNGVN